MNQTTLSTLESHLWEDANILRGLPVDRSDWKSYILPLMFFKRICDVWDEEFEEAVKTYREDFADEHRFQVPEGKLGTPVISLSRKVLSLLTGGVVK